MKFKYLGSTFNDEANLTAEIQKRLDNARGKFAQLKNQVFKSKHLSLMSKAKLYKLVVLGALLWDCNNWIGVKSSQWKLLESFNKQKLKQLAGYGPFDYISYAQLLDMTSLKRIDLQVKSRKLKQLGKIQRMEDFDLPKILLYSTMYKDGRPLIGPGKILPSTREYIEHLNLFDLNDQWNG